MTGVTESVGEFGLEAKLASGVQFGTGFPLLLAPLTDCSFQQMNFIRLASVI